MKRNHKRRIRNEEDKVCEPYLEVGLTRPLENIINPHESFSIYFEKISYNVAIHHSLIGLNFQADVDSFDTVAQELFFYSSTKIHT